MKISYQWLKEYIDLPAEVTVQDMAKKLTFAGLEVESLVNLAMGLDKVVVGEIIERKQHPNADRLSLTLINIGKDEKLEIVCGAQNIKAGQKIPVATIGAKLPNGLEIKAAKIRNVPSQGMLCSLDELCLPKEWQEEDGIYILSADAKIGMPIAQYLNRDDWVFDINITPNRGDALSHIGVARDVAALYGLKVKEPEVKVDPKTGGRPVSIDSKVSLELCPRYFGRMIEGVNIAPSPAWLKKKIESIGLRSINNIVDITSFVMFEIGQPLHAFDADCLHKDKISIQIRGAKKGEKFITLADKEIELLEGDLLITNEDIPVALAGVIGGKNSEVSENTKNIFLEAVEFKSSQVRKTGRRISTLTDAGYRFERGVDPSKIEWAMHRATDLICQLAGGIARPIAHSKDAHKIEPPLSLRLRSTDLLKCLGKAPELQKVILILRNLGISAEIAAGEQDVINVQVPHWRKDIKRTVDLVEEVIRIWGYENLGSKLPLGGIGAAEAEDSKRRSYFQVRRIRRHLASLGFMESLNYGFTSIEKLKKIYSQEELREIVEVKNPVTLDYSVMKPSLLSGLLDNLAHNFSHNFKNLRLFEIRRVFHLSKEKGNDERLETGVKEDLHLAILLTGDEVDEFWQGKPAPVDFYSAKGSIESIYQMLGISGMQLTPGSNSSFFHPGQSGTILKGKTEVGRMGRLHPAIEKKFECEQDVFYAELNLDAILSNEHSAVTFKEFSNFPLVERDFSVQVKNNVNAQMIRSNVLKSAKPLIKSFCFFDVYKGSRIPEGEISYAFRVELGANDHTLTDAEIAQTQEKIMKELEKEFQGKFAGIS